MIELAPKAIFICMTTKTKALQPFEIIEVVRLLMRLIAPCF